MSNIRNVLWWWVFQYLPEVVIHLNVKECVTEKTHMGLPLSHCHQRCPVFVADQRSSIDTDTPTDDRFKLWQWWHCMAFYCLLEKPTTWVWGELCVSYHLKIEHNGLMESNSHPPYKIQQMRKFICIVIPSKQITKKLHFLGMRK